MIFANLARVLRSEERLRFTVQRQGDELVVLLEPLLSGDSTANLAPEILQARAYLATPLHFKGSPASLDADFAQRLTGYAEGRQTLVAETDTLQQRLKEAAKETRAKSVAATARTSKTEMPAREVTSASKATNTASNATSPSAAKEEIPASRPNVEEQKPLTLF